MGKPIFELSPENEPKHPKPRFFVTFVTETYRPEVNGVSNTLGHLVDGLLNHKNVSIQVVRPRQSKTDAPIQQYNYEEFIVAGIPIPGYNELNFGLPCKRKLIKLWKEKPPGVVYLATEGPLGSSALKAAKALGVPTLSGFHTNFHSYIEHYHLPWAKQLVFRHLRKFHNHTAGTLVPTKAQADQLREDGFERVDVMGRGVDIDFFSPTKRDQVLRQSWGLDPEDIALIYVGRLASEKNIDLAIRVFDALRRKKNHLKLILVGDGPIYSQLQKRADPQIILCGMRTGEELARHYASGDIFLFPSLTDTFGNVVTEAMASGLAVVSFDYAAAQMHIKSGSSGFLAPFGNQHSFIDSAFEAITDKDQLNSVRSLARSHAETLGWAQIVLQFKHKLEQIQIGGETYAATDKVQTRIANQP